VIDLASEKSRDADAAFRAERPLRGLRIIVADDDRRMREFYQAVLTDMQHKVIACAADGSDLVSACLEQAADLVVTDIRMPDIDGLQAARIISQHKELPFVFVSAYHDDVLVDTVSVEYSYGYLVKPIRQEDLATTIPVAMRRFWERQ
jgi:AmiR/NasT family two-component response regulator